MKRLLSKQDNRVIDIIDSLHEKDWIISEEILAKINCSERTLRSDIKHINDIMVPIKIETSLKLGLKLRIPDNFSIKYVYSILLENSSNFAILEKIFFNEYDSLQTLSKEVFQSESTVKRAVDSINRTVFEKGFKIDTANQIKIVGEEHAIIGFYRSYFFERYNGDLPFDQLLFKQIRSIISDFYDQGDIKYFSFNLNVVALYVVVRIIRLRHSSANQFSKKIDPIPVTEVIQRLNEQLSEAANLPVTHDFFSDIWRDNDGRQFFLSYSEFHEGIKNNGLIKTEYEQLNELAKIIEQRINIPIENKELFIFTLYTINLREQLISPILCNESKALQQSAKRFSPYFQERIDWAVKLFTKQYPSPQRKNLFYNVLSSFYNFLDVSTIIQPKFSICLVTLYNDLIFKNNYRILDNQFRDRATISLEFLDDLNSIDQLNSKYDLIITDICGIEIENTDVLCMPYDMSVAQIAVIDQILHHKSLNLGKELILC